MKSNRLAGWLLAIGATCGAGHAAEPVAVDLSGYRADCGIEVEKEADGLAVTWPLDDHAVGRLVINLRPGEPTVRELGQAPDTASAPVPLFRGLDPVTFMTVGTREAPAGRPPEMSVFNTFFDNPARRPHATHRSELMLREARVTSQGRRVTVALGTLTIGPFAGELRFTLYAGTRLLHVEAVVRTDEDRRAFTYDAGLASARPLAERFAWIDTEGQRQTHPVTASDPDRPLAVRHRLLVAEGEAGSLACFPTPHAYFYPRDDTDNQSYLWFGRGHRGLDDRYGFGIRQTETGGGNFVPWFNAPPGTDQHLGVFYLLSDGGADAAMREVLRFTHGDRFPDLPGHKTLATHWHMAIAMAAIESRTAGREPGQPDFVRMFKDMNVDLVHLGEFHGDGHPRDPGPLRLPELEAMFAECRRLSDPELLLIPGEEANVHLGLNEPGKHPGHWMLLFPRPVYWIMSRRPDEPFVVDHPTYGRVYRVGDRAEMQGLLELESGLAWTAHPRIKASSWTPDIFRGEDFYRAETWLGAAWKAMPADLSRERLGERGLDLLDDMANWGPPKYLPGEVDVFKLDHTHELYGHMNVNYLRLDRIPRFDEGWQAVLDALRSGRFFTTTGEVILRSFEVGGKASGERLDTLERGPTPIRAEVSWTFPLRKAMLIRGDGRRIEREAIDLADTGAFGERTLDLGRDLDGWRWIRLEVWDVAGNGAYTQPVWLGSAAPVTPSTSEP